MKTLERPDHLTPEQRDQAITIVSRIVMALENALPDGISVECLDPMCFEPANRPSPDNDPDNMLYGIDIRTEVQDVTIDFRNEPERVAVAKLREWAAGFSRAADDLEATVAAGAA